MMKKLSLFLLPLILLLCSWVDRDTIDTYTGSITFQSASYDVTQLSGTIEFYLMDYGHLGLDSSGALLNASSNTIKGVALINGIEYPIQFTSNGGLQIQQDYISNSMWRTTWVNYRLYPEELPSSYDLSDLAPIALLFLVFMFIPLSFYRGILQ